MGRSLCPKWCFLQGLKRGFYMACSEHLCLCVFLLLIQSPGISASGWWFSLGDMLDGIDGKALYNPLLIWWPVKELPLETRTVCVHVCVSAECTVTRRVLHTTAHFVFFLCYKWSLILHRFFSSSFFCSLYFVLRHLSQNHRQTESM